MLQSDSVICQISSVMASNKHLKNWQAYCCELGVNLLLLLVLIAKNHI